jgi:excisionase family DNA binding protein
MKKSNPLTLTVEEAAAALGVSRGTAYEAARTGRIPSIRIGRRLVVPIAGLRAMLGETPESFQRAEEPTAA